jgi:outer membrane lipoprotein carrier protein
MRRAGFIIVIPALAIALTAAAPSRAGDPPRPTAADEEGEDAAPRPPSDPRLTRILEQFDAAQRQTTTMVAAFTERKELRLLEKPVVSRGEFYYNRPNRVRWEYLEPDRKIFVITEEMYLAYYPALKRAEEVPIRKFVGRRLFRFLGLGQSIEELGKYYEFRLAPESDLDGTHLLLLTPRKRKIRERVAEMKIWVDAGTFLPRQFQYLESDGDSTTLAFKDVRTNVEVAEQRFHIDLPKDVMVSETFNGFSLGQQSF